jgi:hypothetical protein
LDVLRLLAAGLTKKQIADRLFIEAVGAGDIAAFAKGFHPDATWNHRNPDRLGGIKRGIDEIVAFLGASMELTAARCGPSPGSSCPMARDTWP